MLNMYLDYNGDNLHKFIFEKFLLLLKYYYIVIIFFVYIKKQITTIS